MIYYVMKVYIVLTRIARKKEIIHVYNVYNVHNGAIII